MVVHRSEVGPYRTRLSALSCPQILRRRIIWRQGLILTFLGLHSLLGVLSRILLIRSRSTFFANRLRKDVKRASTWVVLTGMASLIDLKTMIWALLSIRQLRISLYRLLITVPLNPLCIPCSSRRRMMRVACKPLSGQRNSRSSWRCTKSNQREA